jgi:hypothetical protein
MLQLILSPGTHALCTRIVLCVAVETVHCGLRVFRKFSVLVEMVRPIGAWIGVSDRCSLEVALRAPKHVAVDTYRKWYFVVLYFIGRLCWLTN